ncbi:phosphoenolpyruvate--protein phosphotransferase [Paenibacillus senegalensis]|uniref:phosphoenolpyruvate--protein phosphotransferase n=1 Tax=Paenibacillus senegalensis TaxID=1465766 RepID=UPI000289D356|nr:phosphoenolpyruvate--protein phosphotransferase [Paenibacillus senegalensis]
MSSVTIKGLGVSDGIKIGKAFVYKPVQHSSRNDEPIAEDQIEEELERLSQAKQKSYEELMALADRTKAALGEEKAGILSGQAKLLSDPAFYPKVEQHIREKLSRAENAVQTMVDHFASRFESINNAYMQERAADIRDLGRRLLGHLYGDQQPSLAELAEEVILIADDLAPSDTVQLNKQFVLGFVTRAGGQTSHTSLLARSLGIAAVVGAGDAIDSIRDGDQLIIDGGQGLCLLHPEAADVERYRKLQQEEADRIREWDKFQSQPAQSKDGVRVETAANIGTVQEAETAAERNAEGIGLYRTEFLFMNSKQLPDEEEQFAAYRQVAEYMGERPVIVRTLDIGGDKELGYMNLPKEDNPFLGYRAIRIGLDRKELLLTQLRAILRASAYGNLNIMFPMISSLSEWRQAKQLYEQARQELMNEQAAISDQIQLGIMVEIPSAALQAPAFAKEVDFFSIGTNDLVQYTLAVDRMNEKVAYLYDYFHPAVLVLIRQVIEAAHQEGKWAGMCGGMAGDPLAAPLLLGMRLDEWSMESAAIAKIKKTISHLDSRDCKRLAEELLKLDTPEEVRERLKQYRNQTSPE